MEAANRSEFMQSASLTKLAPAFVAAQAQIRPAQKNRKNPHFKSDYADLASVWESAKEALSANGLGVIQMPVSCDSESTGMTTLLIHSSGEYLGETLYVPLLQKTAQAVGSADTYMRRYALAALLGIVADDDDDGNEATSAPPAKPSSKMNF